VQPLPVQALSYTDPAGMDKDHRDDFTYAKLSDLKIPVTFRMYALLLRIADVVSSNYLKLSIGRHQVTTAVYRAPGET
jgi:hypothetical protein